MLSPEHVKKFQAIYKDHFGREISTEEACEKGIILLRLMKIIYKPMTVEEYEELQKRREEIKNKRNNENK